MALKCKKVVFYQFNNKIVQVLSTFAVYKMKKFLIQLFKLIVWVVASIYFIAIILTHLPFVQKRLGEEVAAVLAKELDTYVSIGSINLGFLNRITIEDVEIKDQQKESMLKAKTISATPDIFDILKGKVTLNAAQLFGADIRLYKETADGDLNCQFIIDKLSNPDSKEPSKLDLRINTCIIRNSSVSYDLRYLPKQQGGIVDVNHIKLSDLSANVVLYQLKAGDIDLAIKKLAFKEAKGIELQNLTCDFTKEKNLLKLKQVDMKLLDGSLRSDSIIYNIDHNKFHGDVDATYKDLSLSAQVFGGKEQIVVDKLNLSNDGNTLRFNGKGAVDIMSAKGIEWRADITDSNIDVQELKKTFHNITGKSIGELPKAIEDARYISFSGKTNGLLENGFKENPIAKINGNIDGQLKSGFGDAVLNVSKTPENINAKINTDNFQLGKILNDSKFNLVAADLEASMPVSLLSSLKQGVKLEDLHDLALKGEVKHFDYDGKTFKNVVADLKLNNSILDGKLKVAPQNIASFDADMHLNISGLNEKKLIGELTLNNLTYEKYHLNQVHADLKENLAEIKTDLAEATITGDLNKKNINSDIHVYEMAKVDKFLGLGLDAQGSVDALLHMRGDSIFGNITSPLLSVSSFIMHNVNADFDMMGKRINSAIKLDNGSTSNNLRLNFNSTVNLLENSNGGISGADVDIKPSQVFIRDTLFNISDSRVRYNNNVLAIKDLEVKHGQQHVIINGRADRESNDSIVADINDIDVAYILNFVKFHAVDFEGKASGMAVVKKLFSTPEANAMLTVENFRFEGGRMGTLYAKGSWNNEDSQIDIDALCDDEGRMTKIDGYISPKRNYIDLGISANNTRGEFVANYCKSFLSNTELECTGNCRIWGDLSYINLTGVLSATGKMHVKSLGTDYTLKNQLVELVPNDIIFMNDTIRDKYGHIGVVTGSLHHQYLSRLTFDVNVKPYNMLCYDFPTYGNEIFFGKAFCSGDCDIIGRAGSIVFNVNAKAEKGSFIEYNASNPDAITGQQFIKWNNRTIYKDALPAFKNNDYNSDIRLNVTGTVDPQSTLRILMDSKSGDMISLHGNGDLRATYYNKGKFELYGNYAVESGTYKMTIQNLIQKNFQFQDGSQIVFGGEPYDAALSLKAKYPVNGVPLSDLQIGNSFKNNNVHVDCIMDISGTPEHPVVDFDLDLPTVNADAKSMINSLLNSEQEKNQQVLYLLAIGRFYTAETATGGDAERQSQASLAMQSFLSGTISQQINNALGTVTKNNNWNLGANIAPGDEGLYNAEYEGLLSGSLLNNRLLINGEFGYRDNPNSSSSFIGDFDVRYLLVPSGNIAVRVYNQTNDRYFTRSSLNTQGLGLIFKYDFQKLLATQRKKFFSRLKKDKEKK